MARPYHLSLVLLKTFRENMASHMVEFPFINEKLAFVQELLQEVRRT